MLSPETMIYVRLGGRKYTLPVNPEEISVSHPHVDKTAEVAGVGEILIPQKPGLREISFESFFPDSDDDPYTHDYRNPKRLAKAFENAWKNRTKCRLIISRSNDYDTNMSCVVSDWNVRDRGGEPGDLYYSVTFREYRAYGVRQLTVINQQTNAVAVTASASVVRPMDHVEMVVGATVLVNGVVYVDPGATMINTVMNGERATITRIDSSQPAPYYVGSVGWAKADAVQLVEVQT